MTKVGDAKRKRDEAKAALEQKKAEANRVVETLRDGIRTRQVQLDGAERELRGAVLEAQMERDAKIRRLHERIARASPTERPFLEAELRDLTAQRQL